MRALDQRIRGQLQNDELPCFGGQQLVLTQTGIRRFRLCENSLTLLYLPYPFSVASSEMYTSEARINQSEDEKFIFCCHIFFRISTFNS